MHFAHHPGYTYGSNDNHLVDTLNPENIEFDGPPAARKMIIGSFSMFVIFSYLQLLYILVAIYLALHHAHH
ncbi:uncharacterized protein [Drosophila kikkawai]|uniref:Uncharacterized protein n=1 Tax=Drosophila kikkawai TaxID=30033 RepID=A0A6P4ICH5_DROKI|nr:uncharacterized protein LOC108073432 [Drosophila kikkawai]KAH8305032.1 hypothetical protein KR059_002395 [Drosophila kikkawai]